MITTMMRRSMAADGSGYEHKYPTAGGTLSLASSTLAWGTGGNITSSNDVRAACTATGALTIADHSLRFVDDSGAVVGDDFADALTLWPPTTDADAVYGGTGQLFGFVPTVAMVKSANFGVAVSVANNSGGFSNYLRASGFDFSAIPDAATITGLGVTVERQASIVMGNMTALVDSMILTVYWEV